MSSNNTFNYSIEGEADTRSIEELEAEIKKAEAALRKLAADDPGFQKQAGLVSGLKLRLGELKGKTDEASGGARDMGKALDAGARSVQGLASSGFSGLTQNLEGLAMGLGATAATAGGLALVGAAVEVLLPHIIDLMKAEGLLGQDTKKLAEITSTGLIPSQEAAAESSQKLSKALAEERAAIDAAAASMAHQIDLMKKRAGLQSSAEDAQLALDLQDVETSNIPPEEKARIKAQKTLENQSNKNARADAIRKQEMNAAGADETNKLTELESLTQRRAQAEAERRDKQRYFAISGELPSLRGKAEDAQTEKANFDRRGDFNPAREKELNDKLAQAQQAVKDREATLKQIEAKQYSGTLGGEHYFDNVSPEDAKASVDDFNRRDAEEKKRVEAYKEKEADAAARLREASTKRKNLGDTQALDVQKQEQDTAAVQKKVAREYTQAVNPGAPVYDELPKDSLPPSVLDGKDAKRGNVQAAIPDATPPALPPSNLVPDNLRNDGNTALINAVSGAGKGTADAAKGAAASNAEANAAVVEHAKATAAAMAKIEADNEKMKRELEALKSQMKNR